MADTSSPKEFLQEALELVDTLTADRGSFDQSRSKKLQIEKAVETLRKNIDKEKKTTVESRRADIEKEFDKKIRKVEGEIEHINGRRTKARDEMVKKRVDEQTAGLKNRRETLIADFNTFCKENKVPAICRTRLYYKLFCPGSFGDWFILIIAAALMVGGLIGAFKINDLKIFLSVLAAVVVILIIYAFIWSSTKGKHTELIKTCKARLKEIRECEGNIKSESKSIHKDKTDSYYDLGSYDSELAAKNQEKAEAEAQKREAIYQFDNVTKQQILAELDSNYSGRLQDNAQSLAAATAEFNEISQKVAASESRLNTEFVPYIGSRNLTHEAISKMITMIESGEAVSISDAVSKMTN